MPRQRDVAARRELIRRIRSEFPQRSFSRTRLVELGDDHAVLILDRAFVFRFPRTAPYRKSFADELELLARLDGKTPVRLPDYAWLARDRSFGGYRLIPGKEMTAGRFARLPRPRQNKVIATIAQFLTVLHGLDRAVLPQRRAQEPWSGAALRRYQDRYRRERRRVIAPIVDRATLKHIDNFYDAFLRACRSVPVRRVIHGDLSDDHILVDSRRGSGVGIIDFGDAAVGDPASDFCFFWAYGDRVVRALHARYGWRGDDGLLERSHWHYVRFMIDRLYYAVRERDRRAAASVLKRLRRLLLSLAPRSGERVPRTEGPRRERGRAARKGPLPARG